MRKILIALRNYLISNADKTHAARIEDVKTHYDNIGITGKNGEPLNIKTVYNDLHAFRGGDYDIEIDYDEKSKTSCVISSTNLTGFLL